jgi:hypothetical protein
MNANPNGKDHLNNSGVDRKILLKWVIKDKGGRVRTGFSWLRIGSSCGLF